MHSDLGPACRPLCRQLRRQRCQGGSEFVVLVFLTFLGGLHSLQQHLLQVQRARIPLHQAVQERREGLIIVLLLLLLPLFWSGNHVDSTSALRLTLSVGGGLPGRPRS
jgi:hypothetical protein